MFFVGEVEITLHVISFTNLSVKQPCELAVRLSLSHEDAYEGVLNSLLQKIDATTYELKKAEYSHRTMPRDLNQSRIYPEKHSYITKSFRVRYQVFIGKT